MRKIFVVLMLSSALVGCGDGTVTDQGSQTINTESTNVAEQQVENQPQTPVSEDGMLGNKYKVEFGNAEKVTSSYEAGDLLMVTYNFTNNSQDTISADSAVILQGFQDGIEVDRAFDVELTGENQSKSIRPGASLECKALFKLSSTSNLEIEATEFLGMDGSKVLKTYTIE